MVMILLSSRLHSGTVSAPGRLFCHDPCEGPLLMANTMQIVLLNEAPQPNGRTGEPRTLAILNFDPDWMPSAGDEIELEEFGEFVVVRVRWSYVNRCAEKHLLVIVEEMK